MKKKAGVSVYIDLDLKGMVDIIAPLQGTTLSELINNMMEAYIKEHSPSDIIDKKISELENDILRLKTERAAVTKSLNIEDILKHAQEEKEAKQEQEEQANIKYRQEKYNDPETIRSLTFQIIKKTIDWNTIRDNFMFSSAIDARLDVLTYLLKIGKITEQDCKGV